MADPAVMVLRNVKVDQVPAVVYLFEDRLVVDSDRGERAVPIGRVARVTTKGAVRTGRIAVDLVDGGRLVITGLRARDARTAHRTLVRLAASDRS